MDRMMGCDPAPVAVDASVEPPVSSQFDDGITTAAVAVLPLPMDDSETADSANGPEDAQTQSQLGPDNQQGIYARMSLEGTLRVRGHTASFAVAFEEPPSRISQVRAEAQARLDAKALGDAVPATPTGSAPDDFHTFVSAPVATDAPARVLREGGSATRRASSEPRSYRIPSPGRTPPRKKSRLLRVSHSLGASSVASRQSIDTGDAGSVYGSKSPAPSSLANNLHEKLSYRESCDLFNAELAEAWPLGLMVGSCRRPSHLESADNQASEDATDRMITGFVRMQGILCEFEIPLEHATVFGPVAWQQDVKDFQENRDLARSFMTGTPQPAADRRFSRLGSHETIMSSPQSGSSTMAEPATAARMTMESPPPPLMRAPPSPVFMSSQLDTVAEVGEAIGDESDEVESQKVGDGDGDGMTTETESQKTGEGGQHDLYDELV